MDDIDKLTLMSNEYGDVIDFDGLLSVDSLVTLLPFWCVNCYSCYLWGAHFIYVVVVHHIDDAGLMDDVKFLFFFHVMDEGNFSPLHFPPILVVIFKGVVGM